MERKLNKIQVDKSEMKRIEKWTKIQSWTKLDQIEKWNKTEKLDG